MELLEMFKNSAGKPAQERIVVVGVNPIIQEITENPLLFSDILRSCENLKITLIYENETENFNQSLFYKKEISKNRMDFDKLQTYRSRLIGGKKGLNSMSGFIEDVIRNCDDTEVQSSVRSRIKLLQNNLRQFVNIIMADDIIWYCFTTLDLPQLSMYRKLTLTTDKQLYEQLEGYINFLLDETTGGKYLSKPDDELIELYDMVDMPRGIYPRKAFYTTNFQRYSIWAFIFNRKGELLLQQRSPYTADNRGLWDKSSGGHVDLRDSSTIITAKTMFGVWTSNMYLYMGNHLIRVINGIYTLYALDQWKYSAIAINDDMFNYIRFDTEINSLGWSFYKLDLEQFKQLKHYFEQKAEYSVYNRFQTITNHKEYVKNRLISILEQLSNIEKFRTLYCQTLRHLLSFNGMLSNEEYYTYYNQLEKAVKKLTNKTDKDENYANLLFLNVKNQARLSIEKGKLMNLLTEARKVRDKYHKINDYSRWVKCFGLIGDIYKKISDYAIDEDKIEYQRKALEEYEEGILQGERFGRFDELLENCLSFVDIKKDLGEDCSEYMVMGLHFAQLLRNQKMIIQFESLHKTKNIILLRHCESEKNINKVISGEGPLTEQGKRLTESRARQIHDYISVHKISTQDVAIFGEDKEQIRETVHIFEEELGSVCIKYTDLLRSTYLGVLSNQSEKDIIGNKDYIQLERWRNRTIAAKDLSIEGMESPSDFWKRADEFFKSIKESLNNEPCKCQ